MIRLIALDVDGTLLDSRWQVPEANRRALAAAAGRGVEVVLVTGRRFEFTRPVFDQIEGPLTLIVNNGALIKTRDGVTLIRHLLPVMVARRVLEATAAFRASAALVFDRADAPQVVYERLDATEPRRASYFERNRAFIAAVDPLDAALTEDPLQVMFTGRVGAMRELARLLDATGIAGAVSVATTEYEARDFALVDVTCRGCTKGSTLAEWAARRGVPREAILAIGDNLNDREMLEFAGRAVVMGNAVPELRALGWPVTLTNDEGGVAAALDRFVLGAEAQRVGGPPTC